MPDGFNVHMDAEPRDWNALRNLAEKFGLEIREHRHSKTNELMFASIKGVTLYVDLHPNHHNHTVAIHDPTYSRTLYRTTETCPKDLDRPEVLR